MAYSDFTLELAKEKFGLRIVETKSLFSQVPSATVSDFLRTALRKFLPLALSSNSEKARSEWIIAPVLAEVREQLDERISVFSGVQFRVEPENGLEGFCDFLINASTERYYISAPAIVVVEAKKEDLVSGLGQTLATMVAAERFNRQRGAEVQAIFGVVTSGTNWKFLRLTDGEGAIDPGEYFIDDLEKLIGLFKAMIQETGLFPVNPPTAALV